MASPYNTNEPYNQGQPPPYTNPNGPYNQPGVPDYNTGGHPITQQPGYYNQSGMGGGPQYGVPVMTPDGMGMAPAVHGIPANCPPGLEYLATLDQLLIKQKVEVLELMTGFETANKYNVLNSLGQQIYKAKEDTDCCTRQMCGPGRPFEMIIKDNEEREVIHLNRPLRCQACCFPCCLQELEVSSPPGTIVGTIEQQWSIYPRFTVKDQDGNVILKIKGPLCPISCCGDVDFKVLSSDGGTEVGKISKQWTGLAREAFTDADNFGISFPGDLDVRAKATLLGAVFLIDFMFFETKKNNDHSFD